MAEQSDGIELESMTFTIRSGGMLHEIKLRPMGEDGECFSARGLGSVFFSNADFGRAVGFGGARAIQSFKLHGASAERIHDEGYRGPVWEDFPMQIEHNVVEDLSPKSLSWIIDRLCVHCDDCGWQCLVP